MLAISQNVGYTARRKGYSGRTITLKIRFAPFTTIQKSTTLKRATNLDNIIFETAKELLAATTIKQSGIRLLGIKLSSLQHGHQPKQLDLLYNHNVEEKWGKVISSLDKIREKHGSYSIQRASLLKKKKEREHKKL